MEAWQAASYGTATVAAASAPQPVPCSSLDLVFRQPRSAAGLPSTQLRLARLCTASWPLPTARRSAHRPISLSLPRSAGRRASPRCAARASAGAATDVRYRSRQDPTRTVARSGSVERLRSSRRPTSPLPSDQGHLYVCGYAHESRRSCCAHGIRSARQVPWTSSMLQRFLV